ncbi:MAG: hypothetical protein OXI87_01810 [Albidovulum sp.]|nr:hypothetical protein [Albidovulum sp.]MDE0533111.1 hypothetical protein [Albidovulum sp.]
MKAYGNGMLADAHSTPGVFEFGRNRNDPLHECEEGQPAAVFCRRIEAPAHGLEADLVGVVAPSKDEQGRHGFFGACVAARADRLTNQNSGGWFGDWTLLEDDIDSVFMKANESFGSTNGAPSLRPYPLLAASNDQKIKWALTTDDVRLLHWSIEWDVKIYEYMQAMAFKEGTKHPTILVFGAAVAGSKSLRSDKYDYYVQNLRNKKNERSRQNSVSSSNQRASAEQTPDRLTALETRVIHLEEKVYELQGKIQSPRAVPPPPPAFGAQQAASLPTVKVVIAVVCGALLLSCAILLGIIFWR